VRYAYDCTRKDGAVGVDGQSGEDYAVNLTQNLPGLVDRLKSGRYRAQPVRRHFIAKADGGRRGLGIPSFEDKVAQRAIVMLLEPIYEQDFQDCSFGFRPGRSAHEALRAVWRGIMYRGGAVLKLIGVTVGIRSFCELLKVGHMTPAVQSPPSCRKSGYRTRRNPKVLSQS
jgi:hypothetical protein